jgi:hypothetical protein
MIDLRAFYQAKNPSKTIVFDNVEGHKLYIDFLQSEVEKLLSS